MHAINTNGLFNLNDFLPKKPTDVEIKIMQEMFEASVDGEPYDEARFSQYFRPAGMSARTGDPNSTSSPAAVVPPSETVVSNPVVAEENTNTPAAEANNILQMIRSRQTAE